VAKRNPKAKGAKPEDFVNLALLKELDQSGFIDKLYKRRFKRGAGADCSSDCWVVVQFEKDLSRSLP